MPNWNKILTEVEASNQINALEKMRKEYFEIIHRETGRNVISYLLLSGKTQNRIKSLSELLYNQGFGLFHDKSKPP